MISSLANSRSLTTVLLVTSLFTTHAQHSALAVLTQTASQDSELARSLLHRAQEAQRVSAAEARSTVVEALALLQQPETFVAALNDDPALQPKLFELVEQLGAHEPMAQAQEALIAHFEQRSPKDPRVYRAKGSLAVAYKMTGREKLALPLEEEVLAHEVALGGPESSAALTARGNLAVTLRLLGRPEDAIGHQRMVVQGLSELENVDEKRLLSEIGNLAVMLKDRGLLREAAQLERQVLDARLELLEPGDSDRVLTAMNYASTIKELGRNLEALEIERDALAEIEGVRPEGDALLRQLRGNLGVTLSRTGQFEEALEIQRKLLELEERILDSDAMKLRETRGNLGATLFRMGRLPEAEEQYRAVVESNDRVLEERDPEHTRGLFNLANLLLAKGDIEGAHSLLWQVDQRWSRSLPPDNPSRIIAAFMLAQAAWAVGDLEGAREGMEAALPRLHLVLPAGDPRVLAIKVNYAQVLQASRDLEASRALFEEALAELRTALPEGDPRRVEAQVMYALLLAELGDVEEAVEIHRDSIESIERSWGPSHHKLDDFRMRFGKVLLDSGRHAQALEVFEQLHELAEQDEPPGDTPIWLAKMNLGLAHANLGNIDEAEELLDQASRLLPHQESFQFSGGNRAALRFGRAVIQDKRGNLEAALAEYERILEIERASRPRGSRVILEHELAVAIAQLRLDPAYYDEARLAAWSDNLVAGLLSSRTLASRSGRATRETVAPFLSVLNTLVSNSSGKDAAAYESLFAVLETERLMNTLSFRSRNTDSKEVADNRRLLAEIRKEMDELALSATVARPDPDPAGTSGESTVQRLARLSREADALEGILRTALADQGEWLDEVSVSAVQGALAPDSAYLSFRRFPTTEVIGDTPAARRVVRAADRLLLMVVRPGKALEVLDLGEMDPVASLIERWRAAIGRPVTARGEDVAELRTSGLGAGETAMVSELGTQVAQALLGRFFMEIDPDQELRRLHIAPDDALFLVPFGALPHPNGSALLRDELEIRSELSARWLLSGATETEPAGAPSLLLVGAIDYGEASASEKKGPTPTAAADEALGPWKPLPGAEVEIRRVEQIFVSAFESDGASVLAQDAATPSAMESAIPGRRFVHVATHGWYVPGPTLPIGPESRSESTDDLTDSLFEYSPMSMCGLCLTDANRTASDGSRPGLLTAEKLSSFDFSQCELAVLSACDTSVGYRRAGQGVLSLQTGLHLAGARTVVTSLWPVGDDETVEIMQSFYESLWRDGASPHEALNLAIDGFRTQHPDAGLASWGAWVVTGAYE